MAATYNNSLTSNCDKVRFLIQDTDITDANMDDNEINAMITMYGSYKSAAIACCEILAGKYAGEAETRRVGNLTLSNFIDKSKKYLQIAKTLRAQVHKMVIPYAGGISVSDKAANLDADTTIPAFKRRIMANTTPEEIIEA